MDDHVESGGPILRLRDQPLWPLPSASCAEGEDSLSTRIQVVLPAGGGPQALQRRYVQAVLSRYRWLPDTPSECSRHDRRRAREWYEQGVPLIVVEAALLLAATRRALREPYLAPLPRVRALHYFAPVVRELLENPKDPDREYLVCLLRRLRPLAELKLARLRHPPRHDDPAVANRTSEPQTATLGGWRREDVR